LSDAAIRGGGTVSLFTPLMIQQEYTFFNKENVFREEKKNPSL
jgi:hypothetical protein